MIAAPPARPPADPPEDPPTDRLSGPAAERLDVLAEGIRACRLCAGRFAATRSRHAPRPVVRVSAEAPVLIASQAPGARAHASGLPFDDRSGDRLRAWLGVDRATFYDRARFTIVPMAFCFPGYDAAGSDLAPPPLCAATWRARLLAAMPHVRLTLLIGGHAQRWHLGPRGVTETVRAWADAGPAVLPLPHPSWRNTAWLARNPWFDAELVPELRRRVAAALSHPPHRRAAARHPTDPPAPGDGGGPART